MECRRTSDKLRGALAGKDQEASSARYRRRMRRSYDETRIDFYRDRTVGPGAKELARNAPLAKESSVYDPARLENSALIMICF